MLLFDLLEYNLFYIFFKKYSLLIVIMAKNKNIDICKYNIKLTNNNKNSLYVLTIFCVIALLFRNKFNINVERVLLFILLLSLLLVISKNWVISLIGSVILFLLFNLLLNIQVRKSLYVEKFNNSDKEDKKEEVKNKIEEKKEELKKKIDSSDFLNELTAKMQDYSNNKDIKAAANGLNGLLNQLDGGIPIKSSDKKETKQLDVSTEEYENEEKFDPMKRAQKETYELINMVDALKNTMETLAPVLSQGKEIMNMFESFKM